MLEGLQPWLRPCPVLPEETGPPRTGERHRFVLAPLLAIGRMGGTATTVLGNATRVHVVLLSRRQAQGVRGRTRTVDAAVLAHTGLTAAP